MFWGCGGISMCMWKYGSEKFALKVKLSCTLYHVLLRKYRHNQETKAQFITSFKLDQSHIILIIKYFLISSISQVILHAFLTNVPYCHDAKNWIKNKEIVSYFLYSPLLYVFFFRTQPPIHTSNSPSCLQSKKEEKKLCSRKKKKIVYFSAPISCFIHYWKSKELYRARRLWFCCCVIFKESWWKLLKRATGNYIIVSSSFEWIIFN